MYGLLVLAEKERGGGRCEGVAVYVIRMIKSGWSVVPSDRCWKRDLGYCGKCDIGDEGEAMAVVPTRDLPEMITTFDSVLLVMSD